MKYAFKRRTYDLPEGIEAKKTFDANSYMEALQQASNYWFDGKKVTDIQRDSSDVITLLSNRQSSNVIGTLMDD